jgi:prepilin-type N-terminal cleavage/methylation domain-containing protein
MARLKRTGNGFTLVELVIAVALSAVVLLAASNLLINFGNFSSNVVKNESSLMGTALGAFEEISGRITMANQAAINPDTVLNATAYPVGCAAGSCIQLRVDAVSPGSPSVFTNDTLYTYWLDAGNLRRTGVTGDSATGTIIASDVTLLTFIRPDAAILNEITVTLDAQPTGGAKEHLITTAVMRSRSAN